MLKVLYLGQIAIVWEVWEVKCSINRVVRVTTNIIMTFLLTETHFPLDLLALSVFDICLHLDHTHQHGTVHVRCSSCSVVRQEVDDLGKKKSNYSNSLEASPLDYFCTLIPYPVHLNDYTWLGAVVAKCGVINAGTVTKSTLVERARPLCMFWSVEHMLEEVLASSTVVIITLCLCCIIVCWIKEGEKN